MRCYPLQAVSPITVLTKRLRCLLAEYSLGLPNIIPMVILDYTPTAFLRSREQRMCVFLSWKLDLSVVFEPTIISRVS